MGLQNVDGVLNTIDDGGEVLDAQRVETIMTVFNGENTGIKQTQEFTKDFGKIS